MGKHAIYDIYFRKKKKENAETNVERKESRRFCKPATTKENAATYAAIQDIRAK